MLESRDALDGQCAGLGDSRRDAGGHHSGPGEELTPFQSGPWVGGSALDESGKYSYCSAALEGPGSAMIVMATIHGHGWRIGLSDPAWHLQTDETYPIRFRIDLGKWWDATAKAVSATELSAPVPADPGFLDRFQHGSMLEAKMPDKTLTFSLPGVAQLIPDLTACADRPAGAGRGAPNP
jgi:hypothetical protein